MSNMQEIPSTANIIQWKQVSNSDGLSNIDRLYQRFQGIYMQRWGSQFTSDAILDNWRETWSEGLAGLNPDQVKCGLNECLKLDWPPSLPEFRRLCIGSEHQINYEDLFHEAAKLSAQQAHGVKVQWPSALLYWSADAFGWDELRFATWMNCQKRWTDTVDEMRHEGILPPIPAHEALPVPGKTTITMEKAATMIKAKASEMRMQAAGVGDKDKWGLPPNHWMLTVHMKHTARQSMEAAVRGMRGVFRWPEEKILTFIVEQWQQTDKQFIERLLGRA